MSRYGFRLLVLLLGILAVAVTGCRRAEFTFVPVEGTVTKDGRPLRDVEVVFLTDLDSGTVGPRATATTNETGHYRLRSHYGDDGAVVGKHRVLILDLEANMRRIHEPQQKQAAPQPAPKKTKRRKEKWKPSPPPRVPPRYGRFDETPLRTEVGHEPLVFDIVIP